MKKKILGFLLATVMLVSLLLLASCNGNSCTVDFDPVGGIPLDYESVTVTKGSKIEEPVTPTRKNFIFLGWYYGDEEWDFANDVVNEDMVISAKWEYQKAECAHDWDYRQNTAPTCVTNGYVSKICKLCKARVTEKPPKLGHDFYVVEILPTCTTAGYKREECRNGCTEIHPIASYPATGDHDYGPWTTVVQPTEYVSGREERVCKVCKTTKIIEAINYKYKNDEAKLDALLIGNYLYTGGSYTNAPFVNIAKYGVTTSSSFYSVCSVDLANDGNTTTYWNADTYVDGAVYENDWIAITFNEKFDIGAINLIVPNYTAWELGEGCHVSYQIEYLDENGEFVPVGEISDKVSTSLGLNCGIMLQLGEPVNTSCIRARVTHASRYAPAVVYEMEVFANTPDTVRVPTSSQATLSATASGKWNEWVSGVGAAIDGKSATYWWTDARYREIAKGDYPYAHFTIAQKQFMAAIQWDTALHTGRTFKLEVFEYDDENPDGHWVDYGSFSVPKAGVTNENVVAAIAPTGEKGDLGHCIFNVNIEKFVSEFKLTLTAEPVYWESYIYEVTPYTISEIAAGVDPYQGCQHKYFQSVLDKTVAPTCTSKGYTERTCVCGEYKTTTKAVDSLGHSWTEYTVKTPATATALGIKECTCQNPDCSAKLTTTYLESCQAPTITNYRHNAPAAWAMSFDDGNYLDTYDWIIPRLLEYKFRATVVMSIVYTDGYINEWKEYFSTGAFDLGSHSYNHTNIYMGEAVAGSLVAEANDAQYWFRHHYKGQKLLVFAAPLGTTHSTVATFLTGALAANRNGGDADGSNTNFYNIIENLGDRTVIGDLNSYISKANQTEGVYVYMPVNKTGTYKEIVETKEILDEEGNPVLDDKGNPTVETTTKYEWTDSGSYSFNGNKYTFVSGDGGNYLLLKNAQGGYSYAPKASNFVYSESEGKYIDINVAGTPEALLALNGTYTYDPDTYKYTFIAEGSFEKSGDGFKLNTSKTDGPYKLVHATLGTYEAAIEKLVNVGGWTIECIHSLGAGSIYSTYASTMSKLEHLKRLGVWTGSYNDVVLYLKELRAAKVQLEEYTETKVVVSVTDNLDDYMFDYPVTVKIDIPDTWTSVTVTQNGVEIPVVSKAQFQDDMITVSAMIDDGFIYVDAVPDGGNVVVSVNP